MKLTNKTEVICKTLSKCHFVNHKYHIKLPGVELGSLWLRPLTNFLSHDMGLLQECSIELRLVNTAYISVWLWNYMEYFKCFNIW